MYNDQSILGVTFVGVRISTISPRWIAFASSRVKSHGDGEPCPPSDPIDDDLHLQPRHLRSDRSPRVERRITMRRKDQPNVQAELTRS